MSRRANLQGVDLLTIDLITPREGASDADLAVSPLWLVGKHIGVDWVSIDSFNVAPSLVQSVLERLGQLIEVKAGKVRLRMTPADIRVRLPINTYRAIRLAANRNSRTMSAEIAHRLAVDNAH